MESKLLSIIIPSFNMELYLTKCLDSLILPDKKYLRRLDVIVVNDGSTDRTSRIAHSYASRYPEIVRVIDKKNGHYGSCINAALPLARGAYVKVLDADDWFDSQALLAFLRELDSFAKDGPDVVFTDYLTVDERGGVREEHVHRLPPARMLSMEEILPWAHTIFMHGVTYRRMLFEGLDYRQLEGICYTDTEWIFLPLASAQRFYYCNISLYRYLIGREGQSADIVVVRKSIGQYILLLKDMADIYQRNKGRTSRCGRYYMLIILMRLGRLIYWINLTNANFLTLNKVFTSVDRQMEVLPRWLYNAIGELDFCSGRWGKRHISRLRKWGRFRWFYFCGLKIYSRWCSLFWGGLKVSSCIPFNLDCV